MAPAYDRENQLITTLDIALDLENAAADAALCPGCSGCCNVWPYDATTGTWGDKRPCDVCQGTGVPPTVQP